MDHPSEPTAVARPRSHPLTWLTAMIAALLVAGAIAIIGVGGVAAASPIASPSAAASDSGGTKGATNDRSHVCPDKATDSGAGAPTTPSS